MDERRDFMLSAVTRSIRLFCFVFVVFVFTNHIAKLYERLVLNLTDTFTREMDELTNLGKRFGPFSIKTESESNNVTFTLIE